MVILHGSAAILRITSGTGADIDVHADYVDHDFTTATETFRSGTQNTAITTATDTTVVSATGSATVDRNIKRLSIYNIDVTAQTVTISHSANGSVFFKMSVFTLAAGESAVINDQGVLFLYDTNGAVKTGSTAASDTVSGIQANALQADMETGTSIILNVTPGRQHFHPGHPKCWGKITVAAGTPTLAVSYNTTSITDTATDQVTVTIGNDFSSANYACQVSIEAATTTLSATTTSLAVFIRTATLAAGSFIIQACEFDIGGATDPASWHYTCLGDI